MSKQRERFGAGPISWGRAPLVYVALALIAGIYLAHITDYTYTAPAFFATIILIVVASSFQALRARFFALQPLITPLLLLAIFSAGCWRASATHLPNDPFFVAKIAQDSSYVGGRVEQIRPYETYFRFIVRVDGVITDSVQQTAVGKVLLDLPPDTKTAVVRVGDRVVFPAKFRQLNPAMNPGAFDARDYWATQSVYHRVRLYDAADWRHLRSEQPWQLRAKAERLRRAWFKSLQRYLVGDDLAVAAALIMGNKDLLTTEVRSTYAETGASHILAVSGLHVGIIFLIIRCVSLLYPGRKRPVGRFIVVAVSVFGIWLFAFVSGLTPSVMRAAIMFSIVAVGRLGVGAGYLPNTLAAAALLMLWANPNQLFQVGFQLSFLALLGIVFFTSPVERWLGIPKYWRKISSAITASLGAQLGTLPITLYVFKQLPALALLTGSFVVLFAFAVMIVGVAHGFFALFGLDHPSIQASGYLLTWLLYLQNTFIYWARDLGGLVKISTFPVGAAALLAGAVAALFYFVNRRWWPSLLLSVVLAGASWFWARSQVQSLGGEVVTTVYHLYGETLVDHHERGVASAWGDSLDAATLERSVLPNRRMRDYEVTVAPAALDTMTTTTIGSHEWTVLAGKRPKRLNQVPLRTDYLLIRLGYKPKWLPDGLPDDVMIVVDGSNPVYLADDWQELGRERGINVWVTSLQGAYQLVE